MLISPGNTSLRLLAIPILLLITILLYPTTLDCSVRRYDLPQRYRSDD